MKGAPFYDGWRRDDEEAGVVKTIHNDIKFTRGLGDHGKKYQLVELDCRCGFDRGLRIVQVSAEMRDNEAVYCLNPMCPHYHDGDYDFIGMHAIAADEPAVENYDEEESDG